MRRDTHVTICTISFFLSVSPYYVIYCISKFCFFIFVGCINCCISNIYLWLLKHARSPYSCIWIQWGLVIALIWGATASWLAASKMLWLIRLNPWRLLCWFADVVRTRVHLAQVWSRCAVNGLGGWWLDTWYIIGWCLWGLA